MLKHLVRLRWPEYSSLIDGQCCWWLRDGIQHLLSILKHCLFVQERISHRLRGLQERRKVRSDCRLESGLSLLGIHLGLLELLQESDSHLSQSIILGFPLGQMPDLTWLLRYDSRHLQLRVRFINTHLAFSLLILLSLLLFVRVNVWGWPRLGGPLLSLVPYGRLLWWKLFGYQLIDKTQSCTWLRSLAIYLIKCNFVTNSVEPLTGVGLPTLLVDLLLCLFRCKTFTWVFERAESHAVRVACNAWRLRSLFTLARCGLSICAIFPLYVCGRLVRGKTRGAFIFLDLR